MLIPEPTAKARKMDLLFLLGKPGGHPLLELEGGGGALPEPQGLRVKKSFIIRRDNVCWVLFGQVDLILLGDFFLFGFLQNT